MSILGGIRWQDIVDILLNSYILFRLYVLFRETYVFRVLSGLALLWIFQRIAVFLGLILTSWVLQGITAVAALIIIIVFRNEIRSVLQAKNLRAIFWGFPQKSAPTTLQLVVNSVNALSKKHIGALIVLPGKEDLKDIVQSGIAWRGLVSREMITSIFWEGNPVHDGAAIIEGDRITEVGTILPLSHRSDLPSRFGTRHRAALGLAERTDALIIVVSEETGNVLVAKDSRITNIHDNAGLLEILQKHFGLFEKDSGYIRKEKFRTGIAALLSVLFITGMWFSFSQGLGTLITLEVPVEYINLNPKFEIIHTSVNTLRLHMGGSSALIKSIRSGQIQVKLDLNNAILGRNVFPITNSNITLPPGIFLRKVVPSMVEVTLDETIEKELPVQVNWVGELPKGLILSRVDIDPKKVDVIGGKRIMENLSTIYTEKVPLDGIKKTGTTLVNLALTPAALKLAPGSRDKIRINYIIKLRRVNVEIRK